MTHLALHIKYYQVKHYIIKSIACRDTGESKNEKSIYKKIIFRTKHLEQMLMCNQLA